MKIKLLFIAFILVVFPGSCTSSKDAGEPAVSMAVEFVDHAASAHIARNLGWFEQEGLNIKSFDNYMTGMSLASALIKGDINAAYICLVPAVCARANGKVPLKIVAGTHKYGYGLLVDPEKIKSVKDLENPDIRIGCPREGSPNNSLLYKMIEKYNLDKDKILKKVRRMSPSKVLMALKMGQLDAGFSCEQFPSIGETWGFKELVSARDLWPEMQGSVLMVTEDLLRDHPDVVEKLVKVTERGINFINQNPKEASEITAKELSFVGKSILPVDIEDDTARLEITPDAILTSLTEKMECTTDIDPLIIQETIDYLAELGSIEQSFDAEGILDLRFLNK